VMLRRCHSFE